MVKIAVANLGPSEFELDEEQTAEELDLSLEGVRFLKPLRIRCRLTKNNNDILIKGEIAGQPESVCSRCLKQFQSTLAEKFEHYCQWKGEAEIDITDQVRETVILSFPIKMLCQPECKGLCPICGQNLNFKTCGCKPPAMGMLADRMGKFKA